MDNKKANQNVSIRALASVCVCLLLTCGATVYAYSTTSTMQPAAFEYTGTHALHQGDINLTGKGVTIAAICRSLTYVDGEPQDDYQFNMLHDCFTSADVSFTEGIEFGTGTSGHATAIGGILIGNDPNAYHPELQTFEYIGAAPQATVDVYEFWRFLVRHVFAGKQLQADIVTMSIGTVFQDWWTRGLELLAEKEGIVIVASIGNGSDVFDNTALYPGAGANIIGVGVIDSLRSNELVENLSGFSLPHPEHSSNGPTADGRSKPDIVAPGNCLVPDANSTNGYEVSGDWSSFATPVVAGTIGLLTQEAKDNPELTAAAIGPASNCVMKAIVMNSARKLPYWHKGRLGKEDDHEVSVDYLQGAGELDALAAYEQLRAGQKDIGQVSTAGWDRNEIANMAEVENVYILDIPEPEDKMITATLVWNRHFEQSYPYELKPDKSDLRLEVWAIDEEMPENSYLLDYCDSANDNVEHIYAAADPNYSRYEIVIGPGESGIRSEGAEAYGIAWRIVAKDDKQDARWYDLNSDTIIDHLDFAVAMDNLEKTKDDISGYIPGDIDLNGVVTIEDLMTLMNHISQDSK